jgi:uncharacterized MAPEG superfamily protein
MSFAYWMVLAAALLPYLTVFLAKQAGGIDNRAPRRSLEALTGWRKRADWAQRNHFEAFPLFAVAVIVAELHQTPQGRLDLLAGIYVAFRVVYTAMYLADWASLRTLVWLLSFATAIWIFVLGA